MKKTFGIVLFLLMAFALSACGIFGGEAEDSVDDLIETHDGGLKHLQPLSDSVEVSDDYSTSLSLNLSFEDPMDPNNTQTLYLSYAESFSRSEAGIVTETKTILEIDDETFELHYLTVEDEDTITYYILADRLLDELQQDLDEEAMSGDIREIFAIDHDMMKLVIDKEMLDEYDDLVKSDMDDSLAPYGLDIEDIEAMLESMERFSKYASVGYYDDHEHLEADVEKIDETTVATIVTFTPEMLQAMANDLLEDLIDFMHEHEVEGAPQSKEDFEGYDEMMANIAEAGPYELRIHHAPSDLTWMSFEFDVASLLHDLAGDEASPIQAFDLSVFVSITSDIELPTPYTDANDILDEFIKLLMVQIAFDDILEQVNKLANEGVLDEGVYTLSQVKSEAENRFRHFFIPPIFAKNTSSVTVGTDAVSADLYYIDDTPVFNDTLTHAELDALLNTESIDRTLLLDIISLIDEDSYDYKYFLIVFMEEIETSMP